MIATWLMVSMVSSALVLFGVRRRNSVWWGLFAAAIFIAAVGLTGLAIGFRFYKDNLLGGFGLIFGPLWSLGVLSLILLSIVWYVLKRRALRR